MTEPVVTYPLRDVLQRIDERLAVIDGKLDDKASRSDVLELQAHVDAEVADLTQRVDQLESVKDRLTGVAIATIAMGGAAGGFASVIARAIGGG